MDSEQLKPNIYAAAVDEERLHFIYTFLWMEKWIIIKFKLKNYEFLFSLT